MCVFAHPYAPARENGRHIPMCVYACMCVCVAVCVRPSVAARMRGSRVTLCVCAQSWCRRTILPPLSLPVPIAGAGRPCYTQTTTTKVCVYACVTTQGPTKVAPGWSRPCIYIHPFSPSLSLSLSLSPSLPLSPPLALSLCVWVLVSMCACVHMCVHPHPCPDVCEHIYLYRGRIAI
jgi:hypothetical protein